MERCETQSSGLLNPRQTPLDAGMRLTMRPTGNDLAFQRFLVRRRHRSSRCHVRHLPNDIYLGVAYPIAVTVCPKLVSNVSYRPAANYLCLEAELWPENTDTSMIAASCPSARRAHDGWSLRTGRMKHMQVRFHQPLADVPYQFLRALLPVATVTTSSGLRAVPCQQILSARILLANNIAL
jgi:hypothetical protein